MKFSEQWVREWVNPAISTEQLCEQITMLGLEVDGVEKVAGDFTGVVVGEVVECAQHPDADKLRVTKVNVGGERLLDIVCGAPNCRQGLKVACAVEGAELPGDFKIHTTLKTMRRICMQTILTSTTGNRQWRKKCCF